MGFCSDQLGVPLDLGGGQLNQRIRLYLDIVGVLFGLDLDIRCIEIDSGLGLFI